MHIRRWSAYALAIVGLLPLWPRSPALADALRRIERETEYEDRPARSSHARSRSSRASRGSWTDDDDDDDDHDDDDDDDVDPLVAMIFILPWSIPHLMLESPADRASAEQHRCLRGYAAYPHANGPGLLRASCGEEHDPTSRRVAAALGAESGFQLQGVLPATFAGRLLLPKRLELGARLDWLHDVASRSDDRALMGSAHLVYRFAQSTRLDFRTGVGPRLFVLDATRWGVDLLYALDVYGKHPVVFRTEFHVGVLGDALFGQARATLGGMVGRVELYAGYDHTGISDGRGPGAALGGPVAGVRSWF